MPSQKVGNWQARLNTNWVRLIVIWVWQKSHYLNNQVEQALTSAQFALQTYTDMQNPLGTANASRLLGEINMRRGQLSYANSMIERALRTYKAIAYRIGQAEVTISLGELQLLRGFLERAMTDF